MTLRRTSRATRRSRTSQSYAWDLATLTPCDRIVANAHAGMLVPAAADDACISISYVDLHQRATSFAIQIM
jgi:hypothetical protein